MTDAAPRRAGAREWAGLALLALPTVLLGLDVTVLYLVLPSMAVALDPSTTQTLWIMDAYGFFVAGFLITMGTLGDRIGRRRLLMIGVTAFALVSVLTALAPTPELLILARALLGVAGATLMPSTLSLISTIFADVRQRAVAIGVWTTMFAVGMAAGPIVGGALVDVLWWGAAFLLAVPIAGVVLVGAPGLLPEHSDPSAGRPDLTSVALSLTAILPVIYAVKHVAAHGIDAATVLLLLVGVTAGAVFVRRQRALSSPLLDVTLFADRSFSAALAVLLMVMAGAGGSMYLVTQYLQLVGGLTPFVAGLWMGPPALAMFVAAIGAPLVARRVRPGAVMAATLGFSALGYALLATAGTADALAVTSGFALVYLGLGAVNALGTDMVVGAAPAAKSGSAGAVSETVIELGLAVGVAVLGALTTAVHSARLDASGDSAQAFTAGVNVSSVVAGAAIVAAAVLCLTALRHVRALGEEQETGAAPRGGHGAGQRRGHESVPDADWVQTGSSSSDMMD